MVEIMLPALELDDFFVDIHCLGKNPEGEGIIFVVRKNDNILFSMVIDEGFDKEIYKNEGIDKFDIVCWTHPHDDHSTDIDKIISKHTKSSSMIVVPNGIYDVKRKMTRKCRKIYRPIKKLNKNGRKKNGEYIEANQYSVLLENRYIDSKGNKVNLEIRAISPISKRVNNSRNNKNVNMNDLSVCLIVKVNDVVFLFASDIYNNIIKDMNIDKETFKNIIYCKIPHHGSIHSDNLLRYLPVKEGNFVAVTTIYKKNGEAVTPNKTLIDKYIDKKYSVYCTSKSYIDNSKSTVKTGVISTRFKICNCAENIPLKWDVKFSGEATEVKNDEKKEAFIFE